MNDVDAPVRNLYRQLLTAWNERDAGRFAALFAADAWVIGFDRSQVKGAGVADHLRPIFADHPTAAYVAKVRDVRPLGGAAVVLLAIVGMVPPGQSRLNPAVNAVQTLVAEHRGGDWRIVLFQNTPAQYHGRPDLAERHAAELEPLVSGQAPVA